MAQIDLDSLRTAVADNRYFLTTHAKHRMGERKVTDRDICRVIEQGDVIEQSGDAQPFPKALFMKVVRQEPLYVSCAFDGQYAYVVTVHWYDPLVWSDPWTRRKD